MKAVPGYEQSHGEYIGGYHISLQDDGLYFHVEESNSDEERSSLPCVCEVVVLLLRTLSQRSSSTSFRSVRLAINGLD